ncbi:MAG: ABC transporter ATP-binding protein/permease [Thermoanaerobaculia bacterium]|nr:ABC transporter ATP-binding protein/permease [Thermoanaerobaculia bacterium]
MRKLFSQLLSLLNRRQRWQAAILAVALVGRAAVQLLGVASIAPFMGIVADPSIIQRNDWLRRAYELGGFESNHAFLTAVGIASILALTLSNLLSATTSWAQLRFVWNVQYTLSCRMFAHYLHRPYAFFVQRNSAGLHQNILSEIQIAVLSVLMPTLNIIAQSLVIVALVGLLLMVDPVLAMIVVGVLGGTYGLVYMVVRRHQTRLGQQRLEAHQERYKIASEAFVGIKDVKILQREGAFVSRFSSPSIRFARANATSSAMSEIPRYLLETIAFGGILLIVLYYLRDGQGIGQVLPVISLYALAGYRLMPALQTLFAGVAGVRFQRAALDSLTEDMVDMVDMVDSPTGTSSETQQIASFQDAISLSDVTFQYPGSKRQALNGVTIAIPKNTTTGLVGVSGGGKTTLVDLILGLYPPLSGEVSIDNTRLDDTTVTGWRRQIGYVPQSIFLADDTIALNIAFGVSPSQVAPEAVRKAARTAHLHDFIESLPEGYDTVIGERGVRLSGGQRQRIGIARALYHDPEVLVFDEATSALDGATEGAVMDAIHELAGRKTLVIIAHRLTTVRRCDRILVIEAGRIVAEGTYDSLLENSPVFRNYSPHLV